MHICRMDRGMDMPNAAVFEDINYELACVMYNIGAVHGAIAANELRTDLQVSLLPLSLLPFFILFFQISDSLYYTGK